MTRRQFIERAVRDAERFLGIPAGWWGKYHDVTNGGVRVHFTSHRFWRVSIRGRKVSDHDSRAFAIRKAARL